ncbi:MAG: type II secretion system F family protein, partial [bacterium]
MPTFHYLAKSSPEEAIRGEMQAENVAALVARLTEQGLYPLEIKPVEINKHPLSKSLSLFARRKTPAVLAAFTRQLASMLAAGLTLHSALSLLHKQKKQEPFGAVIQDLLDRLRDGQRFSQACAERPDVFGDFYINMIRAGETGGMLELVLEHLADFMEREDDVRKQIQAALAYPSLMFVLGVVTVSILLTFVVPKIVSMFDEIGQALPFPTRILISLSAFTSQYWPVLLLCLAGAFAFFYFKKAQPAFREKLDLLKLKIPFFGQLLIEGEIAQFARTLSALLTHAVPIHHAFEVVIASCKNTIIQNEFRQVADAIRQGGRIGASLRKCDHLPAILGNMVAVAEDTNQLEGALKKIAAASAKDVERRVTLFTKLLEPAMIILIGAFIGFIAFAMMLPIFQMDFVVQ